MSKIRAKFITLISLAALCILFLGLAFSAMTAKKVFADEVTYSPTSVFAAGTGGKVDASEAATDSDKSYIRFTFSDGGRTYFRRDLALKWFEKQAEVPEDSALAMPGEEKHFSMTFSFASLTFETFKISFESAEENITKEGKTTNSLLFRIKEGKLKIAVVNSSEQELTEKDLDESKQEELEGLFAVLGPVEGKEASEDIAVSFSGEGANAGEFVLAVKYGEEVVVLPENHNLFTNIGGNFLEYRSSTSSTPNTPITFEADLAEPQEGETASLTVLMKELNGQKFELTEGRVTDDTDPVLVLNEAVYAYTLGSRFSLTYEAMDVLDDTVQVNRYYYMAKPAEASGEESATGYKAPADEDYASLNTNTYFMPTEDKADVAEGYVSIRLRLDDGRGSDKYVYSYLTWYTANKEDVKTLNEDTDNAFDCILVRSPENAKSHGPEYVGVTANTDSKKNDTTKEWTTAVENYEAELVKLEEKGLSAGSGAYLYLPSLRNLITSKYADYRNLRFYISYSNQSDTSASSETSLRYNALRFEIEKKGEYKFKIFAQDASGNAMRLYDEDGKLVDVTADNVWDIEAIPEFHVTVGYTGATIEKQKSQQTGYLDSTYSVSSFDIVALDYEADYTLLRFDRTKLNGKAMPLYEDFWKDAARYVEEYKDCLVEITAYDDSVEKDDNEYHWDPEASSLSFRPQVAGFYVVEIDLVDAQRPGDIKTEYQVIRVDNPIDEIRSKTNWISENWLSVVFFSISAVLAVAIVVLFVVKPADKKVEEVDLGKLKGKKNKK